MRNESQFSLPRPVWQAMEKWEKMENPKKGCLRGMRLRTIKNGYKGKKAAICLLVRRKAEAGSALERGQPGGLRTQVFLVTLKCSAESWCDSCLGWELETKTLQGHCLPREVSLVLYEVAKGEKKDSRTGEGDLAGI